MAVFTSDELEGMRDCAWVLGEIARDLGRGIRAGVTTQDLDRAAAALLEAHGVRSSFKGYRGYPCIVTTSVNEEVIDGVPGERRLADGDLLKLQLGVEEGGFYAYWAGSYAVGEVDARKRALIDLGHRALGEGIAAAVPGRGPEQISMAIQRVLSAGGAHPIRQYCGHGIGRQMHEEPRIPCYYEPGMAGRTVLRPGEVLAIQVLATDAPTRLRPGGKGGLTVRGDDGVNSVHVGAIVVVGEPPEVLCSAA